MLTPQEVREKAFSKATFGGYTMTQVDEFLDVLTADYSVLYTENAVLKNKLKVLVDKVDEYRSTEDAMRKALLTAQQIADNTIREAEAQKAAILQEAEQMAMAKVNSIREERAAEERRLAEAQRAVIDFTAQARATYLHNVEHLDALQQLIPAPTAVKVEATPTAEENVANDIDENVQRILNAAVADVAAAKAAPVEPPEKTPVAVTQDTVAFQIPTQNDDSQVSYGDLDFDNNHPSN